MYCVQSLRIARRVLPVKPRLITVSSSCAPSSASLYPLTARASGVAMNRVPSQTPSAPRLSAAARPRPSKMPPAATTNLLADRVDDLRHERHRRDGTGVAARFGP